MGRGGLTTSPPPLSSLMDMSVQGDFDGEFLRLKLEPRMPRHPRECHWEFLLALTAMFVLVEMAILLVCDKK